MKNFEFKSQVATSIEQSKRLLELGLKKETADCHWFYHNEHWEIKIGLDLISCENLYPKYYIPAWSLHRLLCLYGLDYTIKEVYNSAEECYGMLICAIEIAIEDGYFNKDYLEERR